VIAADSSALLAIALRETEHDMFVDLIGANRCLIGTPVAFESHMVLRDRIGAEGIELLNGLLSLRTVELVTFDRELLAVARTAFDHYGKGRSPAKLNFGDCMSYAVAKFHDVPLLFKGDDFRLTDIRAAL
jgi:ribonuclease VapC